MLQDFNDRSKGSRNENFHVFRFSHITIIGVPAPPASKTREQLIGLEVLTSQPLFKTIIIKESLKVSLSFLSDKVD